MKKFAVFIGIVFAILAALSTSSFFIKNEDVGNASTSPQTPVPDRGSVADPARDITENDEWMLSEEASEGIVNVAAAAGGATEMKAGSVESQAISNNAINSDFVMGSGDVEENFSRLTEEFLNGDDERGSEKREQFQQFFYSQNELLGGEISLDVIECGARLCVAELRSANTSALRTFMDGRLAWDGFDSKALMEMPSQQPNVRRLIFSHDPEINGITMPNFGG